MPDRKSNPIDRSLLDEKWSPGAITIAGCLITMCPNNYGVFDMPWGFLYRFYQGIFTKIEIDGFVQELEAGDVDKRFMGLYRERTVVWIRSRWKRAVKPSEEKWKGLDNQLKIYPEVSRDFLSYYIPYWKSIEGAFSPDVKGKNQTAFFPIPENPDKPKTKLSDLLASPKEDNQLIGYFIQQYIAIIGGGVKQPSIEWKSIYPIVRGLFKKGYKLVELKKYIDFFMNYKPQSEYDANRVKGHHFKLWVVEIPWIAETMSGLNKSVEDRPDLRGVRVDWKHFNSIREPEKREAYLDKCKQRSGR
jgi:hypothetical protein